MASTRQLRSAIQPTNSGKSTFTKAASSSSSSATNTESSSKTASKATIEAKTATKSKREADEPASKPNKKAKPTPKKEAKSKREKIEDGDKPKKKSTKKAVVLGQDPFPDFNVPSPESCQTVHDLLTKAHGLAVQPTSIPTASLTISGCGEVPSVLDATIRTLLSANTSAANSSRAFRGLVNTFGTINESVNWDAVRLAPLKKVFTAIEKGGLANVKSKSIKKILDEVYEDGQTNGHGLSLDYLHDASDADAMAKLTGFGGIGVKTATCVLMFCLRRAAFPVDTHVFRLSKLLGWVPTVGSQREALEQTSLATPVSFDDEEEDVKGKKKEKVKRLPPVTRDTTFLHLDARIPANLKYGLHQLLIRHGRYCPVCAASGGRKLGINQHGQPLAVVKKEILVKQEKGDGTFEEVKVKVEVKEEEGSNSDNDISGEIDKMADLKNKEEDYVAVDAAGGTGRKGGGLPDGGCILGDLIRWERLI